MTDLDIDPHGVLDRLDELDRHDDPGHDEIVELDDLDTPAELDGPDDPGPPLPPREPPPLASALDLPHGIHDGIPPAVYYVRVPGLVNVSSLGPLARSPAHYRAALDAPEPAITPAPLAFGQAFHAAALEPDVYAARWVPRPDFGDLRRKENKRARDAWRAEIRGRTPIDVEEHERIASMVRALRAHPDAARLLERARVEVTLRWADPRTGLECKGRTDGLVEAAGARVVFDLKTTEDASPAAFARSVATYRYHVQQAFYAAGFAALGRPLDAFLFIAVEKAPPYAVAIYQLSERAERRGQDMLRRELETLAEAFEADHWPAYPLEVTELDLPPWA